MVTTFYPPYSFGGDALFVQRLSEALARRGHTVDVVHSIDSYRALSGAPVQTPAPAPGIRIHGLESRAGRLAPLLAHQFGSPILHRRRLRALFDSADFDVTHFHNISLFGPNVLYYGRGLKLLSLHEHWLLCEQHTLFRRNRELCDRKTCVRCSLSYRRPPQWWRLTGLADRALAQVDRVIAPSRAIMAVHRAGGIRERMSHLPNSVPDVPPGQDDGRSGLPERPFFLFAGRLETLKGLQTIIPVFKRQRHLALVVAGRGSQAGRYREMAEGATNIVFTGQLSAEALHAAYRRAIAVIMPSLTYESFPLVIPEAMAAGAPVIARDLGACGELAREGGGFTYLDEPTLIAHLYRLASDPELRAARSRLARRAYEELWREDLHVARYLALINEARAAPRSRGARIG